MNLAGWAKGLYGKNSVRAGFVRLPVLDFAPL